MPELVTLGVSVWAGSTVASDSGLDSGEQALSKNTESEARTVNGTLDMG